MHMSRAMWKSRILGIALSIALGIGALMISAPSSGSSAQAAPVKNLRDEVKTLAERMGKNPDRLWTYTYEIAALAAKDPTKNPELAVQVAALFDHEDESVRMAAAALTLSLGSAGENLNEDAVAAVIEIIAEGKPEHIAAAARTLVGLDAEDSDAALEALAAAIEEREDLPAEARVALQEARLFYTEEEAQETMQLEVLREWTKSADEDLARWAVLSLAKNGNYAQVAARVADIAGGAGEMATYARILIENESTKAEIKKAGSASNELVSESISTLLSDYDGESYFYSEENVALTVDSLLDNAYRGMAGSLDRFSTVMTASEYNRLQESNANTYAGIGAFVNKSEDDEAIRISQPIYSGPAYAAGLRSGDMLWKAQIDGGEVVSLVGMEVAEAVKILKGPEGSKIRLWVKRPGQEELVRLELTRATVQTDPAPFEMLPADIGYIKLKQFGNETTWQRFLEGMRELWMEKRAKGVILDLRENPGGLLSTVRIIAGLLLEKDAKITTVRGMYPPYDKEGMLLRSLVRRPFFLDTPMVVLINGSSASGSELLSGTLQDHKRATLIGETSFGKGIGQSFYPITEKETFDRDGSPTNEGLAREAQKKNGRILKSTIFAYYIEPSGRSIDIYSPTPGVRPDIEVHNPVYSSWEVKWVQALMKSEKLDKWVRESWEKHKAVFMEIATFDGYSEAIYPEFDKLYAALETPLGKDRVRKLLRNVIRRFGADERQADYIQDYQVDRQLQRAIVELATQTKTDLSGVKEYAPFAGK